MEIEVKKLNNGWRQMIFTFKVEVKPRWWEFWKREIPKQTFTSTLMIKEEKYVSLWPSCINIKAAPKND